MADKIIKETPKTEESPKTTEVKKKSGWFQKIPKDVLMSPGGVILVMLAFLIEVADWIPLPFIDQLWELPLEIVFMTLFFVIVKPSIKSMILPFIIERIPLISDIIPSWLLKMFF